jgi:hypothetical protein
MHPKSAKQKKFRCQAECGTATCLRRKSGRRQLAKRYGVSDVAIHKHCRKMGIALPGRDYWAKKASQKEP